MVTLTFCRRDPDDHEAIALSPCASFVGFAALAASGGPAKSSMPDATRLRSSRVIEGGRRRRSRRYRALLPALAPATTRGEPFPLTVKRSALDPSMFCIAASQRPSSSTRSTVRGLSRDVIGIARGRPANQVSGILPSRGGTS